MDIITTKTWGTILETFCKYNFMDVQSPSWKFDFSCDKKSKMVADFPAFLLLSIITLYKIQMQRLRSFEQIIEFHHIFPSLLG